MSALVTDLLLERETMTKEILIKESMRWRAQSHFQRVSPRSSLQEADRPVAKSFTSWYQGIREREREINRQTAPGIGFWSSQNQSLMTHLLQQSNHFTNPFVQLKTKISNMSLGESFSFNHNSEISVIMIHHVVTDNLKCLTCSLS